MRYFANGSPFVARGSDLGTMSYHAWLRVSNTRAFSLFPSYSASVTCLVRAFIATVTEISTKRDDCRKLIAPSPVSRLFITAVASPDCRSITTGPSSYIQPRINGIKLGALL